MFNDNSTRNNCSMSELQKILSGAPNTPSPTLDLPSCDGGNSKWGIKGYPLATVYSPAQEFDNLYELDKGFSAGTIFSELDLPFMGRTIKQNSGGCYDK